MGLVLVALVVKGFLIVNDKMRNICERNNAKYYINMLYK